MNCPRLWNLLEIAVMDIGSRTTMPGKKEGLQIIYEKCQEELGFEKIAQDKDKEITELQDKLHRRNMQIKELKKRICNFAPKETCEYYKY